MLVLIYFIFFRSINASQEEQNAEIRNDANAYGICSLVVIGSLLASAYLSVSILNYSAQRQVLLLCY